MKSIAFFWVVILSVNTLVAQELCQGHYWTEDEANLKLKAFAKTWHDRASWEIRAEQIRAQIRQGLQWEKMTRFSGSLNPMIHSKRLMDGYSVENIAIESFPGFYVTGNLYRPLTEKKNYAAVLSPHGHLKNKRFTHYVQKRAAALARMGAIVFAYDMVGYGESGQIDHKMPIALLLQTWNSKRVLDYLVSRPDVDPNRIGITGGSGGGTQSFMLTAIDPRITAAAPTVQVSAHFFGGCVCESGMPVHQSPGFQTNNVEIAALTAPRPLLLISNGDDWTRNTPIIEYPYIQKVYALYHAEHKAVNVHLPLERHDYGYSKRVAMYHFFAHHLRLRSKNLTYENGYDESFTTILSPEELRVFNTDFPRPENALVGNNRVLKFLGFPEEKDN
ncbi:alpha/beta hydrolase family protein [Sediminicola luteus]|uniref:Acetylxylan esterase n=1 Tax=Sediminicola luteus TaxID=319238 RepID=A0A2A4G287_9FLAO|nr:CocE/NonD family hydrolase [Sediminicola luteus]PCE62543.1 acetylxylan esterase [Sediminicola luteus]